MILADTSIWIDHLRAGDAALEQRLIAGQIVCHPLIVAEIALGSLKARSRVLSLLDGLPHSPVAEISEVRVMVEARQLFSRGIGFVDAALLASCFLQQGTQLWTRDKRLAAVAAELNVAFVAP